MIRNFERSLSLVLKYEGGWSDHKADPGGATMRGITLATFRRYVEPKATKDDLRRITSAQVATVYRQQYWNAVKGDDLPDGIDFAVFDFAVNSGPGRAAKYLQAIVGAKQDGKIGPDTLAKTRPMVRGTVINDLCDKRMAFLRRLSTWGTFGKGWTSRVSSVRSEALKMATATGPISGPPELGTPIPGTMKPDLGTTPKPSNPKASSAETGDLGTTPNRSIWAALLDLILKLLGRKA
ncbi:glycoside hydrolase family 108 protein [Mesorhizobium sp. A556]